MADISDTDRDKAAGMQAEIVRLNHAAEVVKTDSPDLAAKYKSQADKLLQETMAFLTGLGMQAGKDLIAGAQRFLYPVLIGHSVTESGHGLVDAAKQANVSLQPLSNSSNRLRHTSIIDFELVKGGGLRVINAYHRVNPLKGKKAKAVSAVQPTTVKVTDEPTPTPTAA